MLSSEVGTTSSLISLILTLYIFSSIKKVKDFYNRKITSPRLAKKIKKNISQISESLNNFEDSKNYIKVELGKLEANLKHLSNKLDKNVKLQIKNSLKKINLFKKDFTYEVAWEIYGEASKILEEIDNFFEDIKWEGLQ